MSDTSAPATAETVLRIERVSKSYPAGSFGRLRRSALIDLSLVVSRGEIFGYLGPNGSGKTTTLKVLMGLLFADAGTATILGHPLQDRAWRFRTGYLPEHPYLYDYLTAAEYLDYVGRLFGMGKNTRRDRSAELLRLVGLERAAHIAMRRYSKGMVQRAAIAQALMNDPELVFLDEPMSGLDPIGRKLARDIILSLKKAGKTVFFSTHILADAETICDRVGVLAGGRLLKAGRLDEILNLDVSHFEVFVMGLSPQAASRLPSGARPHAVGERLRIDVPEAELGAVLDLIRSEGARLLAAQPVRQTLEEYFFKEMQAQRGGEVTWTAD